MNVGKHEIKTDYSYSNDQEKPIAYNVEKVFRHPGYTRHSKETKHEVAVLKLVEVNTPFLVSPVFSVALNL